MLRMVFATAVLAACHPAPAPTVVHAAPIAAAPIARTSPIRQDFETTVAIAPGPLREVVATGHECRQESPPPIEGESLPPPRRLIISATPAACERHRNGLPVLH